jgi:hypothetical protein
MIRLTKQYVMDNSWLPLRPDMVAVAIAYGMEVKIMGRCVCGHHEEDHDDETLTLSHVCMVEDCTCGEFEPENEEDYDDGDDGND